MTRRAGGFLSLAAGFAAAVIALLIVQSTIGLGFDAADAGLAEPVRRHLGRDRPRSASPSAWLTGRTVFNLKADDPRIRTYLVGATRSRRSRSSFAIFRLLFGPTGYFSTVNGTDPDGDGPLGPLFGGANLSFLALGRPGRARSSASSSAAIVGFLAYRWARRGENARLFPVWVGGADDGPRRGDDLGARSRPACSAA